MKWGDRSRDKVLVLMGQLHGKREAAVTLAAREAVTLVTSATQKMSGLDWADLAILLLVC